MTYAERFEKIRFSIRLTAGAGIFDIAFFAMSGWAVFLALAAINAALMVWSARLFRELQILAAVERMTADFRRAERHIWLYLEQIASLREVRH